MVAIALGAGKAPPRRRPRSAQEVAGTAPAAAAARRSGRARCLGRTPQHQIAGGIPIGDDTAPELGPMRGRAEHTAGAGKQQARPALLLRQPGQELDQLRVGGNTIRQFTVQRRAALRLGLGKPAIGGGDPGVLFRLDRLRLPVPLAAASYEITARSCSEPAALTDRRPVNSPAREMQPTGADEPRHHEQDEEHGEPADQADPNPAQHGRRTADPKIAAGRQSCLHLVPVGRATHCTRSWLQNR
jgi:hypothetical protein